jgi:hypothetical protein
MDDWAFIRDCEAGALSKVRDRMEEVRAGTKPPVTQHVLDRAFRGACASGRLHVCEYLYASGRIRAQDKGNLALRGAVVGGHDSVAEFLLSLDGKNKT